MGLSTEIKTDATEAFVHFKNLIETQYNAKIKCFQSDGGTEYKPLIPIFHQSGIIHRISSPYTPQQNGTSKRKLLDQKKVLMS